MTEENCYICGTSENIDDACTPCREDAMELLTDFVTIHETIQRGSGEDNE